MMNLSFHMTFIKSFFVVVVVGSHIYISWIY